MTGPTLLFSVQGFLTTQGAIFSNTLDNDCDDECHVQFAWNFVSRRSMLLALSLCPLTAMSCMPGESGGRTRAWSLPADRNGMRACSSTSCGSSLHTRL